ncbi:hypothetical protein PANDA_017880, partial [Ailuropoda melanoleuca]
PKPSLSAFPSWVVSPKSNVILTCSTLTRKVKFVFRKEGKPLLDPMQLASSTGIQAKIYLFNLSHSDAGEYTCKYSMVKAPFRSSPASDTALLVVTGSLCKPSLQDLRRHKVTPVRNVALRYHRPDNTLEDVMFVLLKTSTRKRVQHQRPEGKWTDFSLRNVTGNDTGNYSCICYQTKAPW